MGYVTMEPVQRDAVVEGLSVLDRFVLQAFIDYEGEWTTGYAACEASNVPTFMSETITARLASLGLINVDQNADRSVGIRRRSSKATPKGAAILRYAQTGEWS